MRINNYFYQRGELQKAKKLLIWNGTHLLGY